MFEVLVWAHVLCVVVALGANVTYFPWLFRVGKNPEALVFTLKTLWFVDRWVANLSYFLAFLLGCGLVSMAPADEEIYFTSPWIVVSLVLFALLTAIGHGVFSPRLKKQIKLAETVGAGDASYQKVAAGTLVLGYVMVTITVVITALMFFKPELW